MNEHIVKSYEDELNTLTAECARMGGLTEAQVGDSIDAVAISQLDDDRLA